MAVPPTVAELEATVLQACGSETEWPAGIAAGIYAGIDYAIARPQIVEAASIGAYDTVITNFTAYMQRKAPAARRLPSTADEALVAGIVGVVGDHVRLGRIDRLIALRPDLVLLALLPYLGFVEAKEWANRAGEAPQKP